MQDNLALAIKNLVLDKGIDIPTSTPKSNVQDLKKPDLFSLTKETELFQNEKGITIKIDRSKDSKLTNFGKATLDDRYLAEGESYQDLFARVAANYSDNNLHAQRIYNYISNLWFMPATPVLSNAGTDRGLPISCFLNEANDSLDGIFRSLVRKRLACS
jgi:ribonucleoside-diphosphate reductase alpha chain